MPARPPGAQEAHDGISAVHSLRGFRHPRQQGRHNGGGQQTGHHRDHGDMGGVAVSLFIAQQAELQPMSCSPAQAQKTAHRQRQHQRPAFGKPQQQRRHSKRCLHDTRSAPLQPLAQSHGHRDAQHGHTEHAGGVDQ